MKKTIQGLWLLALVIGGAAHASTEWNTQEYDLFTGDFNGDGYTDILYIAKDPSMPSGIALSNGSGVAQVSWQSWESNFLGIDWSSNRYNVIIGDFNGDGKSDIFLQSVSPSGNSYLLLTSAAGTITGISQTIGTTNLGLTWTADQHKIIAGAFSSTGTVPKSGLFLQATSSGGTNAIVLTNANGVFPTTGTANQNWTDGFGGLNWSTKSANVFAGNFNGNSYGLASLLVQAKPKFVTINYDVPFPVPTYKPNLNGVVLATSAAGGGFGTYISSFVGSSAQLWSRMSNGVDWSPLTNTIVIVNTTPLGKSTVVLQGRYSGRASYELIGNSSGAIFPATATTLTSNVSLTSDNYRLVAGNFGKNSTGGLYYESVSSGGANYWTASVGTTGSITASTQNPGVVTGTVEPTSAGRTAGQFAVSASGNATYNIPIGVPPAARGIAPQLALSYSSGSGDGLLGPGWILTGISTIARCGKSWASNGAPSPISLTIADDLCLDGNRLRLTSGTQGLAGSTYQSEIANFSLVTANGTAGGPATSFTVKGKNGRYYEYGASGNSAIAGLVGATATSPYVWAIDKVSDRQGDNMIYNYVVGATMPMISTIQYTATPSTGLGYGYQVTFNYGARTGGTTISKYVAGGLTTQSKQLQNIQISSAGTLVRQFNLGYTASPTNNRPLLSSVQECGGPGGADCIRPTTVTYQTGAGGWSTTPISTGLKTPNGFFPVDLNGDGISDALYGKQSGSGVSWYAKIATSTGYGATEYSTGATTGPGPSTGTFGLPGPNTVIIPGAFSGRGFTQILAAVSGVWWVYTFNGSGFSSANTNVPVNGEQLAIDYDGDGLPDLVSVVGSNLLVRRNTTLPGGPVTFSSTPLIIYTNNNLTNTTYNNFVPADFNGDGRADLIVNTVQVILGSQIPTTTVLISNGFGAAPNQANFPQYLNGTPFSIGDWNGDGCSDVITSGAVFVSNCASPFPTFTPLATSAPSGAPFLATDWDGDGQTDFLYRDPTSSTWYVQRSTGNGIAAPVATGVPYPSTQGFFAADVNSDGQADLMMMDTSNGYALSYYPHNGVNTPPDLVAGITDGWGMNASPTYVPITQNNYTNLHDATFPDFDYQGPMYVVSQVQLSDGTGRTFTNSMWYYGAHANFQGRGFEGFNETQSTDSRNGLIRKTYYLRAFPYIGGVYQDDVFQPDGASLISHTVNSYTYMPLVGSDCSVRCFPYVGSLIANAYDISTGSTIISTSTKSTTFDVYGNQTQILSTTKDNNPASPYYNQMWSTLITNTFAADAGSNWCLNMPTRTTTQSTIPGPLTSIRQVDHEVDYGNCRFTQETLQLGDPKLQVVTNFGYDSCGNPNSASILGLDSTGVALPARTTSTSYGARCTFPETATNPLGQSSTTNYQYNLGVKSSTLDANGVTTTWTYDNFGRKILESRPDGTSTAWSFADCVTSSCWGTSDLRYLVTETMRDSASNTIRIRQLYSDGMERPRYDESNRVLGTWTTKATSYDSLGRVANAYLPYSTASNGYHQFKYDLLNRVVTDQLYNSNGTVDRQLGMAYAGLTTTITDAKNNVTSKFTDVTGKLRQIVDPSPGGTTKYTYDPFGNLLSTVDAAGAITSNVYNIRGFKVSTNDPDGGTTTFVPNSLNEVVSQTDAKGQLTSFAYDLLGRLVSRIEPESTTPTVWTYGSSALSHNIGLLQSVTKPDGYSESYSYDSLSRVQQVTFTEDTAYNVNYAYNTMGTIDTLIYPTSTLGYRFAAKYAYSYGYLQQIKDNSAGTIFWSLASANDSGKPTTELLGNGVQMVSGYTPWTNEIVTRSEGFGASTNGLQNLAYAWDKDGNLQQRVDYLQGLTEAFVDDSLNRLTSSTLNGTTNLAVAYDAAGNITSKSDFGTGGYNYTTAQSGCSYYGYSQPHAVRNAGGNSYCYDADGNMVSGAGKTMSWYSYNQPKLIQYGSNSTSFLYTPSHQRWSQTANFAGVSETTNYVGGILEKITRSSGIVEYRHQIPIGSGSVIYTRRSDGSSGTYYLSTDHLGSGDLQMDSAGNVLARESFTRFGARRGINWQGGASTADYSMFDTTTRRGFTGHEMLDGVSLVHMNGRVYDPYLGKFLSVDPLVQTLSFSQALNPYSYVMNNPLSLVDPSGNSWFSELLHGLGNFIQDYWKVIVAIVLVIVSYGQLAPYLSGLLTPAAATAAGTYTVAAATVTIDGLAVELPAISFVVGGAVTTVGAAVAGAITGAIAGGILGGWHGALIGAESGALFGAVNGYFGNSYGVSRVVATAAAGGESSHLSGGGFLRGAEIAGAMALLQWAGYEMRQHELAQSKITADGGDYTSPNASGVSAGANNDFSKLGGSRWPSWIQFNPLNPDWSQAPSPLGGAQGGPGNVFGISYGAGGFLDTLVEAFAGPHDWLSSLQYDSNGYLAQWVNGGFGQAVGWIYGMSALAPAAVFVVPAYGPEIEYIKH